MASSYILLVPAMLNSCLYAGAAQSVCSRGERLLHVTRAQSDVCVPCEDWTFMDKDNHSHTSCKTCTFIEDPVVEVFVRRCNKTHDTAILCKSGFYRRRAGNDGEVDMCEECTQCAHPYQTCQDYNDTVCCHPSQDTVMTSSGMFVCEERPVVCGPGQFFSTSTKECLPCPDDTFMEEDNHSHTTCNLCTPIEKTDVEVFDSLCSKTHDSVILCTHGFYRRRARNDRQKDRCQECTYCPHPTRACQGYQDTVCCHPNQDAVMTSSGVFVCEERPVVCGPGQFFSTSTEECFPCPDGTFMSAHNHTYKECLKCEQLSENNANHAIITRPCSRTAPTLFGCEDGYFRDPTQESSQKEVPCTPCRSCGRSLVDCGLFHDAVCEIKEEITAVIRSVSGSENEYKNTTRNHNETLDVVENTSESNKTDAELPSCIKRLDTSNVWSCIFIFAILLLGNLILLLILYKVRQDFLEADCEDNKTGHIFFRFIKIYRKLLLSMAGLGVTNLFLLVVPFVTLNVKKTVDEELLVTVAISVILTTLFNMSTMFFWTYFNIIKKNRKFLLDGVKKKKRKERSKA